MASGDPKCHLCTAQQNERWADLPYVKAHAEEGCPYCAAMMEGLLVLIPDIETRFGYDATFRFRNRRDMSVYADPNGSLGYPSKHKAIDLQYRWYTADQEGHTPKGLSGDTSSDNSFAMAKWWIDQCFEKHSLCGKDEPSPLPTRILDLGDGEAEPKLLKLLESADQSEKYIALSHSWGGEQPLITTQATLEDHKTGIPFSALPLTFQDAVRIARRLKIRYLWIDSLCIIQDSPLDWQREASRMAIVYRNSWLTVSATASSSPSSGVFRHDQSTIAQAPDDGDPLAALFPEAAKLRQDLRLSLRFATAHPDFGPFYSTEKEVSFPLLSRAWAYQERFLAPRMLHFGPQELFWECMQDLDCECEEMKWKATKHMGSYANRNTANELPPKISHYAALHVGTGKSTLAEEKKRQKLMSRWQEMVGEYTKRSLTFSSDRLPAFSGVAAEMVEALGMTYCGGQWKETLPVGLLWERENNTKLARLEIGDQRPAPSWSWASVDAPVQFLLDLVGPYPAWAVPVVFAEVLDVQCVPVGADERGQVVFGESFITLSVEMVKAELCFEPDQHADPWVPWKRIKDAIRDGTKGPPSKDLGKRSFSVQVGDSAVEPVMGVLDVCLCDENGEWVWDGKDRIFCAKISEKDSSFQWLVLRKLERDETYERIGVVHHPYADWKTGGKKRVIKLL